VLTDKIVQTREQRQRQQNLPTMDQAQLQQLLSAALAAQASASSASSSGSTRVDAGTNNLTQPLDYTSTIGIKIWSKATMSLPLKFNAEGKEVSQFCRDLQARAKQQGWGATGADKLIMGLVALVDTGPLIIWLVMITSVSL
jgi:hypothetical protein